MAEQGGKMIIYVVQNKVSVAIFEAKRDAENYISKYGSASNGLFEVDEWFVYDDTEKK